MGERTRPGSRDTTLSRGLQTLLEFLLAVGFDAFRRVAKYATYGYTRTHTHTCICRSFMAASPAVAHVFVNLISHTISSARRRDDDIKGEYLNSFVVTHISRLLLFTSLNRYVTHRE